MSEDLSRAIQSAFISPNEPDRNLEPANVVDAIAQAGRNIAGALDHVAIAINDLAVAVKESRP